jgi:FkbM family methyltransferase
MIKQLPNVKGEVGGGTHRNADAVGIGTQSLLAWEVGEQKIPQTKESSVISRDEIIWTYRILLGREPENPDVVTWNSWQQHSLADYVRDCLNSPEFRAREIAVDLDTGTTAETPTIPAYPLDGAPPIWVESRLQEADQTRMWAKIQRSWEALGDAEPYRTVIGDERWRMAHMTEAGALDAFYSSGQADVARLEAWLARAGLTLNPDAVCAEYGCGVGRVTAWLATKCKKVLAFDISASHLEVAKRWMDGQGVRNVEFVLVRGPEDLGAFAGCDLFFSFITLQHNAPPIIRTVLENALSGLNSGGIAFFQIPTYIARYEFDSSAYLCSDLDGPVIEIHCLPQRDVFELLRLNGCVLHEVQPDGWIGQPDQLLSHTFLAQRPHGATISHQAVTYEDIVAAYRLVLLRDPDEAGLRNYVKMAKQGRLQLGELLPAFLSSREYAANTVRKDDVVKVHIDDYFVFVDKSEPEFGKTISEFGNWEPHLGMILREHLRAGDVFVDVGANVGVMSFLAAKLVGPTGKIIAFEPDAENAKMFLRGVLENNFGAFVRLYQFALADRQSLFALEGSSNTYLVDPDDSQRIVQSVVADEILRVEARIDFIKIDIEGYEPHALSGLRGILAQRRPMVLCEFNPRCLRDHAGKSVELFARELFELSTNICAIEYSGRQNPLTKAEDLIELWRRRNSEAVEANLLPDGMLHFDLLFRCDKCDVESRPE